MTQPPHRRLIVRGLLETFGMGLLVEIIGVVLLVAAAFTVSVALGLAALGVSLMLLAEFSSSPRP